MQTDVLILGGGVSGLAAAVKLSARGVRVTLAEQTGKLGGRAYSFIHKPTGDVIDNGQHVLAGAYKHTLNYLDIIGTKHLLKEQDAPHLHFWSERKGFNTLRFSKHLPRMFSLGKALLQFKGVSFKSKMEVLNVAKFVKHLPEREQEIAAMTVQRWLTSLGQSNETNENFWFLLAISVMNELPEKASALLFARSLRATLFSGGIDASILIPTVGQSELYVERAEELLKKQGASILLNAEAVEFVIEEEKISKVRFKNGGEVQAKAVISCIPYFALEKVTGVEEITKNKTSIANTFSSSPIVSVYLWFERKVMEQDFIGIARQHIQWVFNRNSIMGTAHNTMQCLCIVISGAYTLAEMISDEIVAVCKKELGEVLPLSVKTSVTHSFVIKEKRATFSPTPNVEVARPACKTLLNNLFLAGDWTNTGLPATIEGAVQSGFLASQTFFEKSDLFY